MQFWAPSRPPPPRPLERKLSGPQSRSRLCSQTQAIQPVARHSNHWAIRLLCTYVWCVNSVCSNQSAISSNGLRLPEYCYMWPVIHMTNKAIIPVYGASIFLCIPYWWPGGRVHPERPVLGHIDTDFLGYILYLWAMFQVPSYIYQN
jgi:hypothetical protein